MKAMFLMRDVGKSPASAELAANLWANEAMGVTVQANGSGVKIAGNSDEIPQTPVVSSRFLAAAWYEFCRQTERDPRAVWLSDAQEKEEGAAILQSRSRSRINFATGNADAHFSEWCVSGQLTFSCRFASESRPGVDTFLRALNDGSFRLGRARSTHGCVQVVGFSMISIKEAKAWEAKIPAPAQQKELPYAEQVKAFVEWYKLDECYEDLRQELRLLVSEKDPLGAALGVLYRSVDPHGNGVLSRYPREVMEAYAIYDTYPRETEYVLAWQLSQVIRKFPDMEEVREFFNELLKAAKR